jgi:hypothetical protein
MCRFADAVPGVVDTSQATSRKSGGKMESTESATSVPLDQLLAELRAARQLVAQERGPGRQVNEWTMAQATLLSALEAYAAGLTSAGHPLPYRMRDELAMRRRLAGLGGVPRSGAQFR